MTMVLADLSVRVSVLGYGRRIIEARRAKGARLGDVAIVESATSIDGVSPAFEIDAVVQPVLPYRVDLAGSKVVQVGRIIRRPVRRRVEAEDMDSVWVRVGNDGIGVGRPLIQIRGELSYAERIVHLNGNESARV